MFEPTNEQGVIWRFAQECTDSNIQMKEIRTAFPDAVVVKDNVEYLVEFEYAASNFWAHKHNPMKCDLIVCWINDWEDCPIPVVALSDEEWHKVAWTIPDERDKELDALRHEVERLRRANKKLRKGASTKKKNAKNPSVFSTGRTPSQEVRWDKMIDLWRDNPHMPQRDIARILGVGKSTVHRDKKELESAGVIHVNGNGVEILR